MAAYKITNLWRTPEWLLWHSDIRLTLNNKEYIDDDEETEYDDGGDKEEAVDVNLLRAPPISACSISSWESRLTNL